MFQYDDYTNTTVTVNIDQQDKDNLNNVLIKLQKNIKEIDVHSQYIEEIRQLIEEAVNEIHKIKPNQTKIKSFFQSIGSAVNTTATLYTLYQPLKTALLPFGIYLP